MRRRRQHEARTAADRDLQKYVGHAEAAVRQAIDVCGRAARALPREDQGVYLQQSRSLHAAERLLLSIGHLEDVQDHVDMKQEARALLSWLEGRQRSTTGRPGRKGTEYQDALRQVTAFLKPMKRPEAEGETLEVQPEAESVGVVTNG